LEKNAALVDLEVEVNGKSFRAAVKEKVAAQNDYDDAIASGGGGYLVEQGIFYSIHFPRFAPSKATY
jgi:hypothetical protein